MPNLSPQKLQLQRNFNFVLMEEKYPFKPCRLADMGGDLSKKWYLEYYIWDETAEKLARKRYFISGKTTKQRYTDAKTAADEIEKALEAGAVINPKKRTLKLVKSETKLSDAIDFFLKFAEKTTKKRTFQSYLSDLKHLTEFLKKHGRTDIAISEFTNDMAIRFLDELIIDKNLSTRRRNNLKGTMGTLFNFFKKRKAVLENPFAHISKLPSVATKHAAYSAEKLGQMKGLIAEADPQLWLFINFIYYAFVRPGEELRRLRVRDVGEKSIMIGGEFAKNNTTQYVMIPAALERLIVASKIRTFPEDWYVFSHGGPGEQLLGKNYFYVRHLKFLKLLKLDDGKHDLYAWKHTGVIALFRATQNIELIRQQCRHSDIATTQKYLRDLGCFVDYSQIDKFPEI